MNTLIPLLEEANSLEDKSACIETLASLISAESSSYFGDIDPVITLAEPILDDQCGEELLKLCLEKLALFTDRRRETIYKLY